MQWSCSQTAVVFVVAYFVLHKDGRNSLSGNSLYRDGDGVLCVWCDEVKAEEYAKKARSSWETWRVRPSDSSDFSHVAKDHARRKRQDLQTFKIMDFQMAKQKITSSKLLVELFEDPERRRFAIASKAADESEFIVEIAQAMGTSTCSDWQTRLRETLPLIVDMCCKYRGYKADTVQERRELIAGDLEIPKHE